MKITFFSFFMSMFWSNIMILCIFIFRKSGLLTKKLSIISIYLIYIFSVFRTLFPVDFIFSKGIVLDGVFSDFYNALCINKFYLRSCSVSLFQLFLVIWFSGSLILFTSFIYQYFKVISAVRTCKNIDNPYLTSILKEIKIQTKRNIDVNILYDNRIEVPMGMGIFRRLIVLPQKKYEKKELYYILLHEYTHFVNCDILVKTLIQCYCYLFWWNPIVYLLKIDLAQTLELKCDLSVTENMEVEQKVEYLTCLLSVLKKSTESKRHVSYTSVALIAKKDHMVERFKRITQNINTPPRKMVSFSLLSLLMIIAIISYLFVFQSEFEAPINELCGSNTYELNSESSYILSENSKYFIIYDNNKRSQISKESALQMESQGFIILKGDKDK